MQIHSTHKNSSGFTLIELVIAVAVIGILTSVAVLGYNQYKVRAYDAHSKQALRDILLQCNAFWLDMDASQVCNHATVAEVYVASDEIVLKFPAEDLPDLPGGSQGNFCASAQHESSPNTYSIDSASLISTGSGCSGTGGSVQNAAADECERNTESGEQGIFALVESDGTIVRESSTYFMWQDDCVQSASWHSGGGLSAELNAKEGRKVVFVGGSEPNLPPSPFHSSTVLLLDRFNNRWCDTTEFDPNKTYIYNYKGERARLTSPSNVTDHLCLEPNELISYNFETGTLALAQGVGQGPRHYKFKNGERVE